MHDTYTEWELQRAKEAQQRDERRKRLPSLLRAIDVGVIVASYSGSGDSGQIDGVRAFDREYDPHFDYAHDLPWNEPAIALDPDLETAVEEYAYDVLEQYHGRWEINDGSDGALVIDVETGAWRLIHRNFYTESNTEETEGILDDAKDDE